jgi:type II secretory pathway component PulF
MIEETNITDTKDKELLQPVVPTTLQKAKKMAKRILWFSIFTVLLVGAVGFWWKFYYTYSKGSRSGMLQKISYKGNLFKTYEGELILRSLQTTTGVGLASEKFYFSIASDSIAKAVMALEGKNVSLTYEEKKGTLPWRGDSEYIIVAVEAEKLP